MDIVMYQAWIPWILGVVLIGGSVWLAASSSLLRDSSTSTATNRPFSFARVQLLWWVLVIVYCMLRYYAEEATLPPLNETCLLLLGIGVATFGAANVIDRRQQANAAAHGTKRSQDQASKNFLTDILSDERGLSVHRLQAVIFNVLFGVAFVTEFLGSETGEFPVYDEVQFAVLGISTVGYLGLKTLENDPVAAGGAANAGGDELVDADATTAQTPAAVG